MTSQKSIFFASDFHLGSDLQLTSIQREKHIVAWLDTIMEECELLYLVGDVFDYWFEYNEVIPKGCIRLLGKLAEFTDRGIKVHLFTGNHDMWVFDYFHKELGIDIHYQPLIVDHFGKKLYIAHGDGLGPGDRTYKIIKKIFSNSICQWLFHRLHPNFGIWLMKYFSATSRHYDSTPNEIKNMEDEWMVIHSREVLRHDTAINYFVYGHRHIPKLHSLTDNSTVVYLGDWMNNFTFARLNASKEMTLEKYPYSYSAN
jgi:UDP-2,3-diacylglucosamine hydrolase